MAEPIRPLNSSGIDRNTLIIGLTLSIGMLAGGALAIAYGALAFIKSGSLTGLGLMSVGIVIIAVISITYVRQYTKK